jgi:hypothetical protein
MNKKTGNRLPQQLVDEVMGEHRRAGVSRFVMALFGSVRCACT